MLIFNTNIYNPNDEPLTPVTYFQSWPGKKAGCIDPCKFFYNALTTDKKIFLDLARHDREYVSRSLKVFYPHACQFGDFKILNRISDCLLEGLVNRQSWFKMNSYHFCYLYDSANNLVEEYCYNTPSKRTEIIPELDGDTIDFNWFLNTYFFHTAFLIDSERFHEIKQAEKKNLENWSSCLFATINRLSPSPQEIELQEYSTSPYHSKKTVKKIQQDAKKINLYGHGRGFIRGQ